MADKIYKVRDPSGNIREIKAPEGASDEEVIAQAQRLFGDTAPSAPAASTAPQTPSEVPGPRTGVPEWGQRNPVLYGIAGAARESLGPLLQAGAGIAGGLMGTPMGLAGSVGGGALGYAMGEQAMRAADVLLGNVEPKTVTRKAEELAKDVATGAAMEMGGRIAGQVWPSVFNFAKAPIATTRAGLDRLSSTAAAKVARQSAGEKLPEVVNALRSAPAGLTAAQAASPASSFTTQSLIERAARRQPEFFAGTGAPGVTEAQKTAAENVLAKMAGGETQTAARGATEAAKKELNAVLGPLRDQALTRANAGQFVAQLEQKAKTLGKEAAEQVQHVRDLVNAGKIAEASARLDLIRGNLPVGLTKYTYKGELAQMADEWASKAASGSLDLGQGARFAQVAADRLKQLGITPLRTDKLVSEIAPILKNTKYAGNDPLAASVQNVIDDIQKWTSSGGIIDANALYAIRKNSVVEGIRKAAPGMDATSQRNLEAKVLTQIKPLIDDAIERAGGRGFKQYLADYSAGMQEIAKQKLSGEAMRLYQKSPQQFVDLVQGNSPDVVEKFLGPGNYNLGTELAQDALTKLRGVADVTQRGARAVEMAGKGQEAYQEILAKNIPRIKLPWGLSPSGAAINKGLDVLERKLGEGVMRKIAEAAKTAQSYDDLLQSLPPDAKFKFTNAIDEMRKTARRQVGATRTQLGNALLDIAGSENRNALND